MIILCDCVRSQRDQELVVVFPSAGLTLAAGSIVKLGIWSGPLPRGNDLIRMGQFVFEVLAVEFTLPEPQIEGMVTTDQQGGQRAVLKPTAGDVVIHGGWTDLGEDHLPAIEIDDDHPPPKKLS